MPTRNEVIAALVARYDAQITGEESASIESAIAKLAIAQSITNSSGGGGGSSTSGDIIPANTLITTNNPAQLVAIRPDSVINTNTKFLTTEVITLNNIVATPNNRGELPSVSDPRWVNITRTEVIRGFNIYLYNYIVKNSINPSGCIDFNIFVKDNGLVQRAYRVTLVAGNLSFPFVIGLSKPPSLNFSVLIESIQLNPNITNQNLLVEGGKLKAAISSQVLYAVSVPMSVRFDFTRQGLFTQAVVAGAMGFISDVEPIADTMAFEWGGYTPPNGTKVRVLAAPDSTYLPPVGVSYVADASSIDQLNGTFIIRGSIAPVIGKLMRLRLLSGTLGGQATNTIISILSSTQLTPTTWRVTIGNSNGPKISLIDRGLNRWFYMAYVESPDLFWRSPNQLSLDNATPLDFFDELTGSCVITAGTPTVLTAANHGLVVGDRLTINTTAAGVYPAPATNQNRIVYVSEVLTVNTFRISATNGGLHIILTTAGTAVSVIKDNGTEIPIVVTIGAAGSIAIANHGMIVGARLRLGGTTLPQGYNANTSIYASVVANNTITPSATQGGFVCAFGSVGAGVTVSGTNASFNQSAIELERYTLDDGGENGVFNLKDAAGTVLNLTSASAAAVLSAVNPVELSITAVVAPFV